MRVDESTHTQGSRVGRLMHRAPDEKPGGGMDTELEQRARLVTESEGTVVRHDL